MDISCFDLFQIINVSATREQHEQDLSQLESSVLTSQELVRKQTRSFMSKVDKQLKAETNLEQLIADNMKMAEEISLIKQVGREKLSKNDS